MTTTIVASRVGRKPIAIPKGVDVKVQGHDLIVKGPKGQCTLAINPLIQVHIEGTDLKIQPHSAEGHIRRGTGAKLKNSIAGTMRSKINSIVQGVSQGFERKLILVGVGYRAQVKDKSLALTLGFSHPVDFPIPEGIVIEAPSLTEIIIKGTDKHLVGHTASKIRAIRSPEPYKGKGIRYSTEIISLKETKKK